MSPEQLAYMEAYYVECDFIIGPTMGHARPHGALPQPLVRSRARQMTLWHKELFQQHNAKGTPLAELAAIVLAAWQNGGYEAWQQDLVERLRNEDAS